MDILRAAPRIGVGEAIRQAEKMLDQANLHPVAPEWRQRIFELAASLFQSVRMHQSVEKYDAAGARRGGNLDRLDHPLSNRQWLQEQIVKIRQLDNHEDQME